MQASVRLIMDSLDVSSWRVDYSQPTPPQTKRQGRNVRTKPTIHEGVPVLMNDNCHQPDRSVQQTNKEDVRERVQFAPNGIQELKAEQEKKGVVQRNGDPKKGRPQWERTTGVGRHGTAVVVQGSKQVEQMRRGLL